MTATRWTILSCSVICLQLSVWAGQVSEPGGGEPPPAFRMLQRHAAPGEHHRALEPIVGRFAAAARYWLGPGQPPVEVTGMIVSRWIMGRRFVESVYTASLFGEPYEGRALVGYDNHRQKYVTAWIDTHASFILHYEGSCDAGCRVRRMRTSFTEPVSGRQVTARDVTTLLGPDSYRYEAYLQVEGGPEFKQVEIVATRVE